MATYFSKIITERETENYEFCDHVINQKPKYVKAYQLYLSLRTIDENAVKKLRKITPIIANIESQDFQLAGLNVEKELIDSLLTKF